MPQLDYGTQGVYGLSYSRDETFNSCPRKFEIEQILGAAKRTDSVTFSFGHAVAAGIQEYFKFKTHPNVLELSVIACARNYSMDWSNAGTAKEQRAKKNLPYALSAVIDFVRNMQSTLPHTLAPLRELELPKFPHTEAEGIELQFRINYGKYSYEGHIDLILWNPITGKYVVVEIKTTGNNNPHPAQYCNSNQALGYSVVLDEAVGTGVSSYGVFYLVYSSTQRQFTLFEFYKSALKRLDWLNNLQRKFAYIDILYQHHLQGIPFPTNGSSCFNFFSPCAQLDACGLDNETIKLLYPQSEETAQFEYKDNVLPEFNFALEDIAARQIERAENSSYDITKLGDSNAQLTYI